MTIKTYFSFNVIFFIPKNEISNNVKVFLFLFYYFFYKKILVPQVPEVPLVPEVPRSADQRFSNTPQIRLLSVLWSEVSFLAFTQR